MTRRVAIVSHTHWDREWYEPYQSFRLKLVDLVDGLLDLLESDPSYRRFLLDGQMAVVDDYLEVRPEAAGRIRALAASGRLGMGPWYILMDEFLVSGETIIRNLQLGINKAAAFGGALDVGYLPDMFGHIAQMPQLLRQSGLDRAVIWRGVPSSITKTRFFWQSPDGSQVQAEYLPVGYSNGSSMPDDAKAFLSRVRDHEEEVAEFLIDDLLLMNGTDHQRPQPWLGRVVAEANEMQDDYTFEITSLPEYLAGTGSEGLESWQGELRSGFRANVLMGVTSNRVDVKIAAAHAERALEQRAEPMASLFLPAQQWPQALLDIAWREMVRNSAHDSICACSVDDVVDAVLHRFAEAREIGDGIATKALRELAQSMQEAGTVVVNPARRARSGVVEVVVSAEQPAEADVQVISERMGLPGTLTLDASSVRSVLGMIQGPRIENDAYIQEISLEEDDTGIDVTLRIGPEERFNVPIAEVKQELYGRLGARPDVVVRISLDQPPIRRIAAKVAAVPGYGWAAFEPQPLTSPVSAVDTEGSVTLGNGLVTCVIDGATGTWSLDGHSGFGRLVDGGDLGDSYNYSPPSNDSFVDTPDAVSVDILERGPVRGRVKITTTYRWPNHIDGGSQMRLGENPVTVETILEVRADDPVITVSTTFVNPSRDHRLRVHLPLPEGAATSQAECAFTVVERGLEAEGRPDELGLATFPARRFVRAGGLTVVFDGCHEYELIDIEGTTAHTLALTLLRSTGMLSRMGMAYRPMPAGPTIGVDGLQLTGRKITTRYALCVADIDPYAMADDVLLPLELTPTFGGGWRPSEGSALTVEGAEVSALRRQGDLIELRVFNPTPAPTTVAVSGRSGWLIDLRGRPIEPFDSSFALGPFAIATAWLQGA